MGGIDRGIIHPRLDFLAQQLLPVLPYDGVAIHGQRGVEGEIDHGVTHGLQVATVGADMVIATHLAPDAVGVDIVGEQLKGVSVDKQAVAL